MAGNPVKPAAFNKSLKKGVNMLFNENHKVSLNKNELVKVVLYEGQIIFGIVEEVDGDIVWLRSGNEKNARVARFNSKIDKFIKLN